MIDAPEHLHGDFVTPAKQNHQVKTLPKARTGISGMDDITGAAKVLL